jgi:hypothetical protein
MRDAAPDPLERLARLAVGDLDPLQTHLMPILEELPQISVGEKVHRLSFLLKHVVLLSSSRATGRRRSRSGRSSSAFT